MCTDLRLRDEELSTLKKKIFVLRKEMEPFIANEIFDATECLRLSRFLDECVAEYMSIDRAV